MPRSLAGGNQRFEESIASIFRAERSFITQNTTIQIHTQETFDFHLYTSNGPLDTATESES